MKILAILGPLGSGKTTLVNKILKELESLRVLVIVNDVGTENVDAKRIKNANSIKALTAGCIGCSDLPAFQAVIKEAQEIKDSIDLVLIEPTGIADGDEIKNAIISVKEQFNAITLLDVRHFERNQALGCMESQLKVSTIVGITWNDSEIIPQKILNFIGKNAPGRDIFQNPFSTINLIMENAFISKPKFSLFLKHEHSHNEHCGCGVHHHDHNHNHGVYSYTYKFEEYVKYEDLILVLTPHLNSLVRAKGVIDGHLFDFVQGDITLSGKSEEKPYGNFIFTEKIKEEIFIGITKIENEDILSKKERMRKSNVSVDASIEAINWQLGLYPPVITPSGILRVDCEADVVYQLAKRDGIPKSIRKDVMQKYVSWRLESSHQLSFFKENTNLAYWKRRLGLNLGYMCYVYPELVGNELANKVADVKPAEILAEGLLGLIELSFDEEMAEEKPETVIKAFSFGKADKDLLKWSILHCLKLSEKKPEWHTRWEKIVF
jgi:G3E family GTPase